MYLLIYYFVAISLNIVCGITFRENLNISVLSLTPLFFLILSIFQAAYFRNNQSKTDFNTNIDNDFTEEEWQQVADYISVSYTVSIPLYIPFILFFPFPAKVFLSCVIFIAALAGGALVYKIKYRKVLALRLKKEREELEEQIKKEEMGKFR